MEAAPTMVRIRSISGRAQMGWKDRRNHQRDGVHRR